MGRRFALALALVLASFGRTQANGDCRPGEAAETATIVAVTEHFEFALDDGRLARAAGLAPAPPDFPAMAAGRAAQAALAARVAGRAARVEPLGPADRWGRIPALIFPEDAAQQEAGALALSLGAARIADARQAQRCAAAQLAAEAGARAAGLGLWSDPYYAVVAAGDRAGLAQRAGQFVLVEGRVRRVGTGRRRYFLDFGPQRDDFTVTVDRRAAQSFEAAGTGVGTLAGARVRVRGLLELTPEGAPRLEASGPGQIERLPTGAGEARR
jgi:hypothetical protein